MASVRRLIYHDDPYEFVPVDELYPEEIAFVNDILESDK